ncbi:LysE family translocator [Aquicella lusitana]|uniref:L-lysine exporter family protein LysE/ArgO n=1 Tax=Aquicella lusitana TaxID=254246 RepID=A0A370GTG4_9COXI|nr:LysE family translocator [Aquicella lusitana]RDI46556.1 L-lysine exporter family protein LysE/ArgO [Aquicella lusitana]VVC74220.1 hypothetical protein AQULUS_19850 [Aquicella lusitana]
MFDQVIVGLFLGWGAAIPIGAINLEMIRRNLQFGTAAGLALGFGACCADVTYLVLLSLGVLQILHHPFVIKAVGILGSLLLTWFGYKALRLKSVYFNDQPQAPMRIRSPWRHAIEGYLLTLINPYTILFWSSISMTIAVMTHASDHAVFYAGLGVLLGTFSWAAGLNGFLHFTRHRLSKRTIQKINIAGGIILIGFAALGFWRALFLL